jgi:hypothetical protein
MAEYSSLLFKIPQLCDIDKFTSWGLGETLCVEE